MHSFNIGCLLKVSFLRGSISHECRGLQAFRRPIVRIIAHLLRKPACDKRSRNHCIDRVRIKSHGT